MDKKDNWIRLASKSRPGRFYMFNKDTGETQWLPLKQEKSESKPDITPQISHIKSCKTPAQDRLKRLQHNLKISKKITRSTRDSSNLESSVKQQEQENLLKEQPTTSSSAKEESKTKKKSGKRPLNNCLSSEVENYVKDVYPSTVNEAKKIRLSKSPKNNFCSSSTPNKSESSEIVESKSESLKSIELKKVDHTQNIEDNKFGSISSFRNGIVKTFKEICKMPFSMSKKKSKEKSTAKVEISSNLLDDTQFKPKKKSKESKVCLSLPAQGDISQRKEENAETQNLKLSSINSETCKVKNLCVPTYPRGSANSRLERLKQSLLSQQKVTQKQSTTTNRSDKSNKTLNLSTEANNNTAILIKEEDNDGIEAMDWQPIEKDEEPIKNLSIQSALVIEKSNKLVLDKDVTNKNETMGDIYDRVNENLLRFSAEKQKNFSDHTKRWRRDFYYFIVDTNVLLKDLTFIEDLTKMKLCDTKGSVLYIPYAVLQELDKLKMRTGCQEGVKTRAVRVIKYLNSKFENNSSHLEAQSALDERRRIIDISSADDSIINCCLQVKEQVTNLLLLTEDINLRNKAISNNIMVSAKSDLVSKRYDKAI